MKTLTRLYLISLLAVLPMLLPVQAASAQDQGPGFTEGEIRQLLAPVALYPDALLSQVLIAATYPLEIVEAERWSRDNPGLEGQAAVDAVAGRDWDPSIKSLVAFPDLLARMSEELDWTRRLGDAFLLQEEEVIAAVQDLRARAEAAGALDRLDHARARRDGDVIVIDPVDPQIVYVPYYSPRIVYGGWGWSAYPPYYWYPPSGYYTSSGFYWGNGIVLSSGFFFSSFDWRYRNIVILRHHRHHFHYADSSKWRHNPKHRRGVVYRSPALTRHFTAAQAQRPQEAPRSSSYGSGNRDERRPALRRSTSVSQQSNTQDTQSSTATAPNEPASGGVRSGSRGSALNRDNRAFTQQRAGARDGAANSRRPGPRDSRRTTERPGTATVQQRPAQSSTQRPAMRSDSPAPTRSFNAAPQRPSAGSGNSGSRPSALNRGMR